MSRYIALTTFKRSFSKMQLLMASSLCRQLQARQDQGEGISRLGKSLARWREWCYGGGGSDRI